MFGVGAVLEPTPPVAAVYHNKLVPVAAAQWMSQQLLQAELHVMKGAAHEPFISHPQDFTQQVTEFLKV